MRTISNIELETKLALNNKFHNNETDGVALEFGFLQQSEIFEFNFKDTNLTSSYLLENIFNLCNFINCNFYGGVFNGSEFCNCTFTNCSLRKTELQMINFDSCTFKDCDLSRSQILKSKMIKTEFHNCNFRGVYICDSFIKDTIFESWTGEMVILSNNVEENVVRHNNVHK